MDNQTLCQLANVVLLSSCVMGMCWKCVCNQLGWCILDIGVWPHLPLKMWQKQCSFSLGGCSGLFTSNIQALSKMPTCFWVQLPSSWSDVWEIQIELYLKPLHFWCTYLPYTTCFPHQKHLKCWPVSHTLTCRVMPMVVMYMYLNLILECCFLIVCTLCVYFWHSNMTACKCDIQTHTSSHLLWRWSVNINCEWDCLN